MAIASVLLPKLRARPNGVSKTARTAPTRTVPLWPNPATSHSLPTSIPFTDPAYWGGKGDLDAIGSLFEWGTWTPESFWSRVLDDVHIDGTIFARQVQWFAGVGQGVGDWPLWMRLRDIGHTGWAVFELDVTPDPVGDLTSIRRYVEDSLGHICR